MTFVAGHFGEWLQGRVGPDQTIALVTLACPLAGVTATTKPAGRFALDQDAQVLNAQHAQHFLAALGLDPQVAAQLCVDLPPGAGAGMSTAALVALARSLGAEEAKIALACLAVEGATDPLMLPAPDAVLWAPRRAAILRDIPRPPEAEIVGGLWGDPVQTNPADLAFPAVDDLVADWISAPDLAAAAAIASASAVRTTALRGPAGDPTAELAKELGALGFARAHTGSARALIFSPGAVPKAAEDALRAAGYSHAMRFRTGGR